jgi:hypothetical protein
MPGWQETALLERIPSARNRSKSSNKCRLFESTPGCCVALRFLQNDVVASRAWLVQAAAAAHPLKAESAFAVNPLFMTITIR